MAHICPSTLLLLSTYRPHITAHYHKINKLQHLFNLTLHNRCQQQICPQMPKIRHACPNYLKCICGGVCHYHCAQMTMIMVTQDADDNDDALCEIYIYGVGSLAKSVKKTCNHFHAYCNI